MKLLAVQISDEVRGFCAADRASASDSGSGSGSGGAKGAQGSGLGGQGGGDAAAGRAALASLDPLRKDGCTKV